MSRLDETIALGAGRSRSVRAIDDLLLIFRMCLGFGKRTRYSVRIDESRRWLRLDFEPGELEVPAGSCPRPLAISITQKSVVAPFIWIIPLTAKTIFSTSGRSRLMIHAPSSSALLTQQRSPIFGCSTPKSSGNLSRIIIVWTYTHRVPCPWPSVSPPGDDGKQILHSTNLDFFLYLSSDASFPSEFRAQIPTHSTTSETPCQTPISSNPKFQTKDQSHSLKPE